MTSAERFPIASEDRSIVIVGNFNPAIFHPFWFAKAGLIRDHEATAATVNLVHSDISSFSTDWFEFQVDEDRLIVRTSDASKYLPLRDLVVGIFRVVEHTPVRAMGMNGGTHFHARDKDEWMKIGHHLAPKGSWDLVLDRPGMLNLSIVGKRLDSQANNVTIRVLPSQLHQPGIYLDYNQHYEVSSHPIEVGSVSTFHMSSLLESEWQMFLNYCESSSETLLTSWQRGVAS